MLFLSCTTEAWGKKEQWRDAQVLIIDEVNHPLALCLSPSLPSDFTYRQIFFILTYLLLAFSLRVIGFVSRLLTVFLI